jgi:hypothetical protein
VLNEPGRHGLIVGNEPAAIEEEPRRLYTIAERRSAYRPATEERPVSCA